MGGGGGMDPALQAQNEELQKKNQELAAQQAQQDRKAQQQQLDNMRRMKGGVAGSGQGGNQTLG